MPIDFVIVLNDKDDIVCITNKYRKDLEMMEEKIITFRASEADQKQIEQIRSFLSGYFGEKISNSQVIRYALLCAAQSNAVKKGCADRD